MTRLGAEQDHADPRRSMPESAKSRRGKLSTARDLGRIYALRPQNTAKIREERRDDLEVGDVGLLGPHRFGGFLSGRPARSAVRSRSMIFLMPPAPIEVSTPR